MIDVYSEHQKNSTRGGTIGGNGTERGFEPARLWTMMGRYLDVKEK